MKTTYEQAIDKHNAAIAVFKKAQAAYRNRTIGDDEYIAAKKAYDAATAEFDIAFAKEAYWV